MNTILKLVDDGDVMPVTLDEVKYNLRIEDDDSDTLLTRLIKAATEHCESYTNRIYRASTWEFSFPEFKQTIDLPRGNLTSVSKVEYYDANNELQELDSESYYVNIPTLSYAWIELDYQIDIPETYSRGDAIKVTFITGRCPESVKQAIHLLVEGFYDGDKDRNQKALTALLDLERNYYV